MVNIKRVLWKNRCVRKNQALEKPMCTLWKNACVALEKPMCCASVFIMG